MTPKPLWLDYAAAATPDLLKNLSGCAFDGQSLWTVSDEGRTIERLVHHGKGFKLADQIRIDDVFDGLPGADDGDEIDMESIDVVAGALWLCGSHCRVRRKPEQPQTLNPEFRNRRSRRLLGRCQVSKRSKLTSARAVPIEDAGSLRERLADDPFLAPFLDLPSKENGLDIEGFARFGDGCLLGLRGPLIDSFAVVVEIELDRAFSIADHKLHFLNLEGLAIREIARIGTDIAIIAGPVGEVRGPFRLHRWRPQQTDKIQQTLLLYEWPGDHEKPEGCCEYQLDGERGLLVVYDSPTSHRIEGATFRADWLGPA